MNVNGNMTAGKLFDVYGATRSYSGTPTTRQGFVGGLGHETDDETGLVYMRARYYDPGTGRFISEDPSRNGTNWFTYCNCSPTCSVDATGKDVIALVAWSLIFTGCLMGLMTTEAAVAAFQNFRASLSAFIQACTGIAACSQICEYSLLKTVSLMVDLWKQMDTLSAFTGEVGAALAIHVTGYAMAVLGTLLLIDEIDGPDPGT